MFGWSKAKKQWSFYPFSWLPDDTYWLELVIFIHIYALAAYLAIKEWIFDKFHGQRIEKELMKMLENPTGNERRALVTGCDGTIGKEICRILLENDYIVQGFSLRNTYYKDILRDVSLFDVDLRDYSEVKEVTEHFKRKGFQYDVAVFAAGIMLAPENPKYPGIEVHNDVNVVAQLSLFNVLKKQIRRSIFLSSATARMACYPLNDNFLSTRIGPYQAYSTSKLNLSVAVEQMSLNKDVMVTVHPGTVPGRLYRHANWFVRLANYMWLPRLMRTPRQAAIMVLHTVLRDDLKNGRYYEDTVDYDVTEWMEMERRMKVLAKLEKKFSKFL